MELKAGMRVRLKTEEEALASGWTRTYLFPHVLEHDGSVYCMRPTMFGIELTLDVELAYSGFEGIYGGGVVTSGMVAEVLSTITGKWITASDDPHQAVALNHGPPLCDCGGEKAQVPHYHWCSIATTTSN